MIQPDYSDTPAGLVSGRLEGSSVPGLLWGHCRLRRTGVLHVTSAGVTKSIYIRRGQIIFGASGDPDDRLGELLLRDGRVSLDMLDAALARQVPGKRLGTLLVEDGAITAGDLVQAVLSQVEQIILGLFPLEEGEYRFLGGPLPTEELITLNMKTGELLLKGIRRVRSFTRVRRSVGPPRTAYRLKAGWQREVEGLDLTEGERALLDAVGPGGATIDELCRKVFLSNFEIYQALWAFRVLDVIEPTERSPEAFGDVTLEGSLAGEHFSEVLARLCRAGETGVMYVSRGQVDRSFHIKEGHCVFATSSDLDDGLVAHLLRRGVISLRDREETARRLLSNRRVGSILREMGVLNDDDLEAMVRDQLAEIVFDTFRWRGGEYVFVPGELPTIEEITIRMSLEDLVFRGLSRVDAWSAVREGCGGLDAEVVLTPRYLDVLDRMETGQDEWEVIAALREPTTVRDVCRQSTLPDFQVCRIVWALRVLEAVQGAPARERASAGDGVSGGGGDGELEAVPVDERERDGLEPAESLAPPRPAESAVGEFAPADPAPGGEDSAAAEVASPFPVDGAEAAESGDLREPDDESPHPEPFARVETETTEDGAPTDAEEAEFQPLSPVEGPRVDEWDEVVESGDGPAGPEPFAQAESAGDEAIPPADAERVGDDLPLGDSAELADERDAEAEFAEPESDDEAADAPPWPPEPLEEPDLPIVGESTDDRSEFDGTVPDDPHTSPPIDDGFEPQPFYGSWSPQGPPVETTRLSPDEIDAAIADQPAGAEEDAEVTELDRSIARFNEMQRVLYQDIRAEIGAGATNFVRSCGSSLDDPVGVVFLDVELDPEGTWDPAGLKRALADSGIDEPWTVFHQLLDEEVDRLKDHIGEARARSLSERIRSIGLPTSDDSGHTARPPE